MRRPPLGAPGFLAWLGYLGGRAGLIFSLATSLSGCGRQGDLADSQVAVGVNKGEISVHQIQSVLQRQPRLLAEQPAAAASQVLEVLIDQELAAQSARDQALDRDPAVVQAIEASRREILARAYFDRMALKASTPSSDELDRYYDEHPQLFAQRRLYVLQEFAVESNASQLSRLQELAARAHSAAELDELLRTAGFKPRVRQFVQAAEDLPLAMLEPIGKLEIGGALLLPQAQGVRIYSVLHAQRAPIDRRTALPAIATFIMTERQRRLVTSAVAELRGAATIEYRGPFASKPSDAASGAAGAAK